MDILYSDSFSRNVAFNCLMFLPEISNRMVSVNGKHPKSLDRKPSCDQYKSVAQYGGRKIILTSGTYFSYLGD